MELNKVICIFVIIILVWFILKSLKQNTEQFGANTLKFVQIGKDRYGLRGDKLNTYSIDKHYRNPNRQIVLNATSGQMWMSDNSPNNEGIDGCNKITCPSNYNDYDESDTCWKCGTINPTKPNKKIEIHSHVPI